MTIIVGTDSYIDVAFADQYWSDRNNDAWASADTANKEKALREATQYLDGAYSFIGCISTDAQVLAWPRMDATIKQGNFQGRDLIANEIPLQIKQATAELALEALTVRLEPVTDDVIASVKVDVIEVDYADFAPSQRAYTFVSNILRGLTSGGGNQINLVRV